jgi:hypothetical protein
MSGERGGTICHRDAARHLSAGSPDAPTPRSSMTFARRLLVCLSLSHGPREFWRVFILGLACLGALLRTSRAMGGRPLAARRRFLKAKIPQRTAGKAGCPPSSPVKSPLKTHHDSLSLKSSLTREFRAVKKVRSFRTNDRFRHVDCAQTLVGSRPDRPLACDGRPSYSVSVVEFLDGKVAREPQYFADPFEPGPSRAQWVERMP